MFTGTIASPMFSPTTGQAEVDLEAANVSGSANGSFVRVAAI